MRRAGNGVNDGMEVVSHETPWKRIRELLLVERRTTMPPHRLTGLPYELLNLILRLLDPLSILHCRRVHSRYRRSCIDSLPEYQAYQTKFQDIMEQHRNTRDAKPPRWTIERAAELFDVVRADIEVDYYLFFRVLLSYPQARSFVSVIGALGRKP